MRSPGRALTRCDRGLQEGDTRRGERPLTLEPGEVGEEPGTGPAGAMGSLAQQPPSSRAPSVQNCEPERSCGVSHSVCGARYSSPSTPSWAIHPSPSRFRGPARTRRRETTGSCPVPPGPALSKVSRRERRACVVTFLRRTYRTALTPWKRGKNRQKQRPISIVFSEQN